MGVFNQLGLLFKKNFIIRKRHPSVVFLEVLWPVLVVVLIAVVRLGVPPKRYTTCHYQNRAMPSAGITPFIQTFVCNMDNQCHDDRSLKQAQETTYSVSALVQDLAPYLGAPATVEALEVMGTGVKIMEKLKEIADDEDLVTGLDGALMVKSFFRDPEYVKKVLTEEFKIMTSLQADAFLNATFNITYVFQLMEYPDFKGVVCDPERLGTFLLFPENVNVTAISQTLCHLSAEKIPDLTAFLQKQIDISEIVRIIGTFERLKARGTDYSVTDGLMDTADMIDLIFSMPSVIDAIGELSKIKTLPDFIRSLPELMNKFNATSFDIGLIKELVNFLDPIIEQAKGNDTTWSSIKLGVTIMGDVSDMFSGKWNGSLNDMMDKMKSFLSSVEKSLGSITGDMKMIMDSLTNLDWSALFSQAANQTVNEVVTLSTLNSLQSTLEKLSIWKTTGPVIAVTNKLLQIGVILLEETEGLERAMTALVDENGVVRKSLTQLFEKGPNITLAVLKEFTDPQTIAKLFESSFSFHSFCVDVLNKLNTTITDTTSAELKKTLCAKDVSSIMENFLVELRIENITILMNETIQRIKELVSESFPSSEANVTVLYMRSMEFQKKLSSVYSMTSTTWRKLFTQFNLDNINLNERQWEPVLNMLDQNYVGAGFVGMARGWVYALQSATLPDPIPMYVHVTNTIIQLFYKQFKLITDVYSPSSDISQLVYYVSTYAPEITEGSIFVLKNHTSMIKSLVTSSDPLQQICDDKWFHLMQLPSYVPEKKIESLLCDTNWTAVFSDLEATQMGFTTIWQKIINATSDSITYNTERDWMETMDYSQRLIDLMQQPGMVESMSPWNVFSRMNFTQFFKSFDIAASSLTNWQLKDFPKMSEISLVVLEGLDVSLQNVTSWRVMKHSFKAFDAYIRFMTIYYKYITNSTSVMNLIEQYPTEFKDYVLQMARVTPELIETLKNTIINPDKFVKKVIDAGFKITPDCSTTWLTDLLLVSSTNLKDFENLTCSLNWTKLAVEMTTMNPEITEYTEEINLLLGNKYTLTDVKLNWTSISKNIEKYLDLLTGISAESKFDFSPFNMTAIDMKWTDFVSGMNTMETIDTKKLYSLMSTVLMNLDKVNQNEVFGSNASTDFVIRSTYANIYIQFHLYKFIVTVLEHFNSTAEVDIMSYLGSGELRRIVHAIELIPEINAISLDTIVQLIMDPNKGSFFMNSSNMDRLCTDLTVFTDLFDMDSLTGNVSASDLQDAICRVNINTTLLVQELKDNWNGFGEFVNAINDIVSENLTMDEMKINVSTIVYKYQRYVDLLDSVIKHPPKFVLFTDMNWSNFTVYEDAWQDFIKKLKTKLNFQEPSFLEKWQKSLIDMMLPLSQEIPNFDLILQYVDAYLDLFDQRLKQSLVSLPEAFKDFPNLSNILYLVNQIPEVFEVITYTSLVAPEKANIWSDAMTTWDKFCVAVSSDLFTIPPSSSFNMSDFKHRMCELNFTQLTNELENYQGTDRLKELMVNGTTSNSVNVSTVANKLTSLVDSIINATSSQKTGFHLDVFNSTIWSDVIQRIEKYISTSSMSVDYMFSYYETILRSIPGMSDQMGWLSTVAIVTDSIFDRLLIAENATSFSLSTFFKGAPEIQKLVELLQEPGLVDVLLESINSRKFLPLFASKNVTETLMMFCDPRENISQYFTIPDGLTVNLTAWRVQFCQVNISVVIDNEVNTIFNMDKIAMVANGSSKVDWRSLGNKYTRVVSMVNRWLENPAMLNTSHNWKNGSFWINLLDKYAKARQTPEEINRQIENLFAKLSPVLEQESFRQFGLVIETLLKLVNKNLVALENTTITVSSMFDKVPILKDIITATGLNPSIIDTLMKAPVTDIYLFMQAMTSVDSSVCKEEDSIWRQMLQLPVTFNTSALHRAVCNQNFTKLVENLLKNLDLKDLMTSLSNSSALPDWPAIFNLSQQLGQTINTFVTSLPKFDVDGSMQMFNNAYNMTKLISQMSSSSTYKFYGYLLETIPGLQEATSWLVVLINIQNVLFDRLLLVENKTSFKLEDIFADSPEMQKLLLFIQEPGVIEVLLTSVNSPKFLPLLSSTNATSTLKMVCDPDTDMNDYLTIPHKSTVDVNVLRDQFCEVNITTLITEADSMFNISSLTSYDTAQLDWGAMGAKYDRVMDMIARWSKTPPRIILPPRWENGSFWLDLLKTYSERKSSPEGITEEVESFIAKFGSLLEGESFRQVGLVMKTVVRILNENVISMGNGTYTLNSMFVKIPVLHDIISSLNLSPDVLEALLTSPVENPKRLAEALSVGDIKNTFCENGDLWREILHLPASFNTSALNEALCNQNTTNIVNNLVKNLDLDNLISALGNSSIKPDWKDIIKQTEELVRNLNTLVANPPTFNFSESMTALESAYNSSNLWDFISIYSTLSKEFENSSEFEAVEGYFKGSAVVLDFLNDILDKAKVTGVTLDLRSLFKDSPSFVKLFEVFLSLNPDPLTALLSIQLKTSQTQAFATVAADASKLNEVFCNKMKFLEYFSVTDNVNITALLDVLCTLNFTAMVSELETNFMVDVLSQKLKDIGQKSSVFDLEAYIETYKQLSSKLTELAGIHNVTFGHYDLQDLVDVNTTALLAVLNKQMENLKKGYEGYSLNMFDKMFSQFSNETSWQTVLVTFKTFDLFLKHFNQYLTQMRDKPLNLESLLDKTELGKLLRPLLKDPAWLDELLHTSVKLEKLLEFVQSENASDILCSTELWDAFVLPANGSAALKQLQQEACSMNTSLLMWQSFVVQIKGYTLQQQTDFLNREAQAGRLTLNSTAISQDIRTTIDLLTTLISNLNNNSMSQFVNVDGFKAMLDKFQQTLVQKLLSLSSQWSQAATNIIWPSLQNSVAARQMTRVINTANIFLETVNNKLSNMMNDNVTLNTLLSHSDELVSLIEAYINISKYGLEVWIQENFNIGKLIELLQDKSQLKAKCRDNSVATFISDSSTPSMILQDLQIVVCTFNKLPETFNSDADVAQIRNKLVNIWKATSPGPPDFSGYVENVKRFSDLMTLLAKTKLTVNDKVKQTLDFSSVMTAFTSLAKHPSLIFQLLKPIGLLLSKQMDNEITKYAISMSDRYVVIPMMRILELFHEKGWSLNSIMTDSSKMMQTMEYFSNYNNQLGLALPLFVEPIFTSISMNAGFKTDYICNKTAILPMLSKINLGSIADFLCNTSPLSWLEGLQHQGLSNVEMYALSTQFSVELSNYQSRSRCHTECFNNTAPCITLCNVTTYNPLMSSDVSWFRLMTDIEKLTNLFTRDSTITLTQSQVDLPKTTWDIFKKTFLNDTLNNMLTYFKLMDYMGANLMSESVMGSFKSYVKFIGTVNTFLTDLHNKFTGETPPVYLQDILPDSQKVADVLNDLLGPQSAAEFITASVNPAKFYSLAFTDKWKDIACDPVEFSNTFKFEAGTNIVMLQTALCTAATTRSSALQKLVDLFEAGTMLTQLGKVMDGSANTKHNLSLWDSIYNVTGQLLNNLQQLSEADVNKTSVDTWLKPILSTITALGKPSISSLNEACDGYMVYINGTETYRQITPVMSTLSKIMRLFKETIAISTSMDALTCDLSNWNLTAVTTRLKNIGFWDIFTTVNSLWEPVDSTSQQCSALTNSAIDFYQAINETMISGAQSVNCFKTSKFTDILDSLSQILQISSDMVKILQDPSLRQLLNKQDKLLPILEFIFKAISQQETVLLRLSDLVKNVNGTDAATYLVDMLKLSPDIAASLLKSTLNLNMTAFTSQPLEEIQRILCNESLLSDFMSLPEFSPINMTSLITLVCTENVNETAVAIKGTMDTIVLIQQLAQLTNTGVDQVWFDNFTTHVVELIKHFQSLGDLASMFSEGVDLKKLEENIPAIDRFLLSSGPDRITQSLQAILEDFKLLLKDDQANMVFDELKIFIHGFMGLDVIQSWIIKSIRVGDFVENPVQVKKYLIEEIGIDPAIAKAILEGTYSIRIFLNASRLLETGLSCRELFGNMIYPNTTDIEVSQLSDALCSLNESTAVKVAKKLIPNLDIGDLLKKYISLDAGSMFEDVGVTKDDLKDFTDKLSRAQDDLLKATDFMKSANNRTSSKVQEIMDELFNLPQAQTGARSLESIKPLLCGKKDNPLATDEFNIAPFISSSKTDKQKEKDEKAEMQKVDEQVVSQDTNSTHGGFCEKMYDEIKNLKYGAIIWSYLSPIIRGKILYTPNTVLTRRIMKKANGVFDMIGEVQRVAQAWAKGGPSLASLLDQAKELQSLKNVLKNNFVKSLLKSSAGLDSDSLLDGLDALESNSVNKTSLDGLTVAAELVSNYMSCVELKRFEPVETEDDLLKQGYNLSKTNNFLAGVVFTNLPSGNRRRRDASDDKLPKHIMYKIRMDTDNVRLTNRLKSRIWYPNPEANFAESMRYLRGFVQLQDMIDQALISLQTGNNDTLPGVYLQQFPFPCHNQDQFIYILGSYLVPVLMTFALLAALGITTRNLVWDRENGQEVVFNVMGMKSSLNWFAWFISSMMIMVVVCFILTLIFKFSINENGEIYRYSNGVIIFLFLLCFCFSSIMICYMVSAFFTRTTLAVLSVLIVYFFSYLPYVILFSLEVDMKFWQKILACLSSTSAFGFGSMYIARMELTTVGLQWDNVDTSPIPDDPMTFQWACIMMLIDSAIYLIIGWYIRNVKPGKYGVSKPWYFPVTAAYWCTRKHKSRSMKSGIDGPAAKSGKEGLFEPASIGEVVGMSVHHLSKKFGKSLVVNDLTAEFYEGQVTALLGHNGAAKTTTINLLLGLLEPTSGDVRIYNKDSVHGDSMIGVCPQHNALLPYMTVKEHMELYAGIKCNWSSKQKKLEITSLLHNVDLWHVRNVVVSKLSGGMQRRLCVALAFVGGSRAIILDEPTSGVDPSARKSIWNLIVRNKPGRTILLSTHHLDEADMIGDRIVIMHMGQLLCSGTSMFLKEKLGGGYHLTVERAVNYDSSEWKTNPKSNCNAQAVLNFIHCFLPNAKLVEEVGSEIVYQLPSEDRTVTPFHRFFQELDLNQDSLCISSYGVSDTTLEDVFLKVTNLADDGVAITDKILETERLKSTHNRAESDTGASVSNSDSSQGTTVTMVDPNTQENHVSGCGLKMQQFGALFLKRFHHYRRDWRSLFSIIVLPFILFLVAMGFGLIRPLQTDMPNLIMTPSLYGPDKYMFYKDGYAGSNSLSNKLVKAFTSKPGIGTTCMKGFNAGPEFECKTPGYNFTQAEYTMNPGAKCECWNWQLRCDPGADFPPPPKLDITSGNYLQKLDGRDVPDYLLKSYHKFVEMRYGGWAMEEEEVATNATPVQIWFNNKGYHSIPSFFNGYSNALLRAKLDPASNPAEYGITTYNHPITLHGLQLSFENLGEQASDAGISLVMLLSYSFIPAALMIYLINERIHKEKQMQYICGVGPVLYWSASFLWDMMIYSCTVALMVVSIAIFRNGQYWELQNLQATIVLVLLFGWAVIPMMYCTLRLFSSASSAYMTLFCLNMFIGLVTVIVVVVMKFFPEKDLYPVLVEATEVCQYLFLIFPQYCMSQGLIDLAMNFYSYKLFFRFGKFVYKDPFSFDMIGLNLVVMAVEGVIFFILNLIIESKKESLIRVPHHLLDDMNEDEDVARERDRIQQAIIKEDILIVNDLSKVFKRGKTSFMAVDRLSFGVNKGECFGLLGVNGAGKTTTFRMMTGDLRQSAGSAVLNGKSISCNDSSQVQSVGYCPQDGGLDNFLTGAELLHFHSRLKGLSAQHRKRSVMEVISRLQLTLYADKPISTYSGGTKRKLSLAIAMIGNPAVLFLDEPTTGMDPGTRRLAWKCITQTVQTGQSVVLTSHSMNECDALCSRLAIMVNGKLMCLGSGQHLKNKFGDGYTAIMHIRGLSNAQFNMEHLFLSRFPGATVKVSSEVSFEDQHQKVCEVNIPRGVTTVAELFAMLEQAEDEGHISYYSLSQTTLDSVFINFAHLQTDVNDDDHTTEDASSSNQSQILPNEAFSNQTYVYTNSQFTASPEDIKIEPKFAVSNMETNNFRMLNDTSVDPKGKMSTKL